jgi:hypothetical protein
MVLSDSTLSTAQPRDLDWPPGLLWVWSGQHSQQPQGVGSQAKLGKCGTARVHALGSVQNTMSSQGIFFPPTHTVRLGWGVSVVPTVEKI